jgi:spore germination protein YaaH
MKKYIFPLIGILFYLTSTPIFALQTLFYTLRNEPQNSPMWQSLQNHYQRINILVPQAFEIDKNGKIEGYVDSKLTDFAKAHNIKIVLLVTNRGFNRAVTHFFLRHPDAQKKAIASLVKICKEGNYNGLQFDFEDVPIADKQPFMNFYQTAATKLHQNQLLVSIAVVPMLQVSNESIYLNRYENRGGSFDYKILNDYSDFVTLMAYNQHTSGTTPGPVASAAWDEQIIRYALLYISPQKIFLGIPVYSDAWYTGMHVPNTSKLTTRADQISYAEVQDILKRYHTGLAWDSQSKVPYSVFSRDYLYEYIFAENAQSFQVKLALARKYNLGGIAVWRLGMEDPNIWRNL